MNPEGQVLKAWREHRGMTPKELGRKAGLRADAIEAYEGGRRRPTDRNLARLCVALEVPTFRLCVEVAAHRAEELAEMVKAVQSEEQRLASAVAELEWAAGVVFHALRVFVLQTPPNIKLVAWAGSDACITPVDLARLMSSKQKA